jgi:transitional endoplasmic reticulum ATPase
MRSGRFDKKIYLGPPDFEARKELFKIFIEKTSRPHDVLDYEELSHLTQDYVSADIQAICDEAARDASNSILDIMKLLQEDFANQDITKLKEDISKNLINMDLLKQAILDTPSSLKMVDMSVYNDWLQSLES